MAPPAPVVPPPAPTPSLAIVPPDLIVPAAPPPAPVDKAPPPVVAPAPPPPPSPLPTAAPVNRVEPVKADAPTELPGLPPLPPAPKIETVDEGVPMSEATCSRPYGSFFAGVEYLYLKPYRSNLDFAIVSPNTNPDPEGSIQSDPWHSRSAFRIGAGYGLPNDGPDIGFYYTYLHDDQIGGLVQPAGGLLFATQTHPGTVELVGRATAEATLSYNVFDLEMGRRMMLGDSLALRPFGGLRFAEIDQNFNITYNGGDANQDLVEQPPQVRRRRRAGRAQVDWMLFEHWTVYGRAAGSLMTGDYNATVSEFNNNGATPLTNVNQSFRKITPVAEMAFGVAYQGEHLRLSLGYEITNWFSLVDTPSFVDDVQQGKIQRNISDLGVDGLAARVEFVY